jgi:uncharacterized protein CbrC (UPF0167 family)
MLIAPNFKYFPEYRKWARFISEDCQCLHTEPCLDYLCFDDPDIKSPVCLSDLVEGRIRVSIPASVVNDLKGSVKGFYSNQSEEQIETRVNRSVDELSRTPPIPWIQGNDWPVCCGDFGQYLGEWDQSQFDAEAANANGKEFLWSILSEWCQLRRSSIEDIWTEMGAHWTTIFVFRCLNCDRLIAVDQSY